jgi:hypothetical protein
MTSQGKSFTWQIQVNDKKASYWQTNQNNHPRLRFKKQLFCVRYHSVILFLKQIRKFILKGWQKTSRNMKMHLHPLQQFWVAKRRHSTWTISCTIFSQCVPHTENGIQKYQYPGPMPLSNTCHVLSDNFTTKEPGSRNRLCFSLTAATSSVEKLKHTQKHNMNSNYYPI